LLLAGAVLGFVALLVTGLHLIERSRLARA
jgi:hypothetical protein